MRKLLVPLPQGIGRFALTTHLGKMSYDSILEYAVSLFKREEILITDIKADCTHKVDMYAKEAPIYLNREMKIVTALDLRNLVVGMRELIEETLKDHHALDYLKSHQYELRSMQVLGQKRYHISITLSE